MEKNELLKELLEQSRLLGMGAERELALQAKVQELEKLVNQLENELKQVNADRSTVVSHMTNELESRLEKYYIALLYIARDTAAITEDCAHDQADMYVAKAREALK